MADAMWLKARGKAFEIEARKPSKFSEILLATDKYRERDLVFQVLWRFKSKDQ